MKPASLLLDPRGAIRRQDYWVGLALVTGLQVAVFLAFRAAIALLLLAPDQAAAVIDRLWLQLDWIMALPPLLPGLLGPFMARESTEPQAPLAWAMLIALAGARLWAMSVLCLKRGRDARLGAGPVIGLLAITALVDLAAWAWGRTIPVTSEMGTIAPAMLAFPLLATIWLLTLAVLGAVPSRTAKTPKVKPSS